MVLNNWALVFCLFCSPVVKAAPNTVASKDPACGQRTRKNYIELSPKSYFRLIEKGTVTILSLNAEICYIRGMVLNAYTVRSEHTILSESIPRGTIKIVVSQAFPFPKAKLDPRLLMTKSESDELVLRLTKRQKRWPEYADQVYVLTIKTEQLAPYKRTYAVPQKHPMAQEVNRAKLAPNLTLGKFVYDVRAPESTKKNPLKGATPLTANEYQLLSRKILTYKEMKEARISYKGGPLPKNKEQEIYILSACPAEYASYNFITLLRHDGYKNISWYRPGFLSLVQDKNPCVTPQNISGFTIIGPREILNMMEDKNTKILDIREQWAKEDFGIKGAEKSPFFQNTNSMGLAEHRKNVTAANLREKKEVFIGDVSPNTIPKNTKVIIYGQNEFDWGAYKAALTMVSMGYSNVFWYRFGMDDWKHHSLLNSKKYPVNKPVKKEDLYL